MRSVGAVLVLWGSLVGPTGAQTPAPVEKPDPRDQVVLLGDNNASETRSRLNEILRQHPPSLQTVLRLDPALLSTPSYLAAYPALAAFLGQHPEIARNPTFFLGPATYGYDRDESPQGLRSRTAEGMIEMMVVLTGLMALLGVVAWLIKSAIDHRRWLRQSKMQTEAHNKLFDRLTSNDDLLAYIQTPVGRRFLESAPLQTEGYATPAGAPVSQNPVVRAGGRRGVDDRSRVPLCELEVRQRHHRLCGSVAGPLSGRVRHLGRGPRFRLVGDRRVPALAAPRPAAGARVLACVI